MQKFFISLIMGIIFITQAISSSSKVVLVTDDMDIVPTISINSETLVYMTKKGAKLFAGKKLSISLDKKISFKGKSQTLRRNTLVDLESHAFKTTIMAYGEGETKKELEDLFGTTFSSQLLYNPATEVQLEKISVFCEDVHDSVVLSYDAKASMPGPALQHNTRILDGFEIILDEDIEIVTKYKTISLV